MAKGLLIAGLRSGDGKTLITLGLLRYLTKRGFKVQPFKVGPDYIDPKWHYIASNLPSYNLDLFSMGKERLSSLFSQKALNKDFALVEGVMGLFDGKFSTFEVAKLLNLPILLVLDAFGVAESLAYVVKGVSQVLKKRGLRLYLFLNRVSSERHLLRLMRALKRYRVVGYLFRKKDFELPSRHLGLFLPEHLKEKKDFIDALDFELRETLDTSFLDELPEIEALSKEEPSFLPELPFKRIGLAYDEAFNFYYQHLLDELEKKAELVYFSPLRDKRLPSKKLDSLFIGGGYPELFAKNLSENRDFLKDLRDFVASGGTIYAECGGLIYLSKGLYWEGKFYPMAGLLPFKIVKKGLRLGYRKVKLKEKHPFFGNLKGFLAHEFHYTSFEEDNFKGKKIYKVFTPDGETFDEGYAYKRVLGSYLHFLAKL